MNTLFALVMLYASATEVHTGKAVYVFNSKPECERQSALHVAHERRAHSDVSGGVDPRYFGGARRFQGKAMFSRRPQSCQNGGSVGLVSGLSSVELSRRG